MSKNRSNRTGFTLAEVLVTVAIVAILAAVVVPAVTNQITKGDEANIASTVGSLRTGITAFVTDTRKFPRRASDLFNAILSTDKDITVTDYGTAAAGRWKGPYMSGSLGAADSLPVGLGFVRNTMKDSGFATSSGYVIATIGGVYTDAAAARIDSLIDNGNGLAAGAVRWRTPTAAPALPDSSVKVLLMGSR